MPDDSTKDKVEGNAQQLGGKVQEAAGEVSGDEELQARGKANQGQGKLQEVKGNIEDAASDAKKNIENAVDDATN